MFTTANTKDNKKLILFSRPTVAYPIIWDITITSNLYLINMNKKMTAKYIILVILKSRFFL